MHVVVHVEHEVPPHAHGLLPDFEFDPTTGVPSFSRCIDVAATQRLPPNSHHESIHTGTAGYEDLEVGTTRAGHGVIPLLPLTPFANCDEVVGAFLG